MQRSLIGYQTEYLCNQDAKWSLYIYLDKEGIAPILKLLGDFHPIVLKMLPSLLPPEMAGLAGFLEPLIDMLFITWPECALLVQSFDLGLDLVPQN